MLALPSLVLAQGFGFVCFSTPDEVTKAVSELNGAMWNSKPLYVALAQRKEVRRAQIEATQQNRAAMRSMAMPAAPFPTAMQPMVPAAQFMGGAAGYYAQAPGGMSLVPSKWCWLFAVCDGRGSPKLTSC